jgi:hypothetical protein
MGYTRDQFGKPKYDSDITDPVGQFQEAVDFADERGLYRVNSTSNRQSASVRQGTAFYDTDLEIIFGRTGAGAWSPVAFPGLTRVWKHQYTENNAPGGRTIAQRAIPRRAYTQRAHVTVMGSSGFGSGGYTTAVLGWTGAGVTVTSNGSTSTTSPTPAGAENGNYSPAGQFTAMARQFDVEIPANTDCTITVTTDASVAAFYRLTTEIRMYGAGEYA